MPHSVSILIPTHNRADLLPQTLASVRNIRIPAGISVELVVVANACTDSSAAVARASTAAFPFPAKVVEEPQPGLNFARDRGVRESSHEIIAFIDDDVLLDPQWLEGLLEVYANHPADIVGGRVDLWWDAVPEPPWFSERVAMLLSRLNLGDEISERTAPNEIIGANFTYKRALLASVGGFRADLGRRGGSLLGGEETEWVSRALANGHRLFYAPRAALKHWVAPKRITPAYLDANAYSMGLTLVAVKGRFGLAQAARSLVGFAILSCTNFPREVLARIRRDDRAYWSARIGRLVGNGGFVGALRRLRGLPIEGKAA